MSNFGDREKERLKEIIEIAYKLKWITPNPSGYPLMQLSEVEKCMVALVDDFELNRMRQWDWVADAGRREGKKEASK